MSGRGPAIPNGPIHYTQVPVGPCPCPTLREASAVQATIFPASLYSVIRGSDLRIGVQPARPHLLELWYTCRLGPDDIPDTCR